MPSSYTSALRFEKIATGEKSGTWSTTTNTQYDMFEQAIAGRASVTHDDSADYTLTAVNGTTDEARNAVIDVSGALTVARNVICPTQSKVYIVKNSTSGGFDFTIKTSAGTGILIPNGDTMVVYCDGTNVVSGFDNIPAGTTIGGLAIVDLDSAQTLTTKTLTTPIIAAISNSGTVTIPTGTDTLVGKATTDTLTNKTLTLPVIVSISNGGTVTVPSGADTLVARASTDTLTNKTLTLPVIASISNTGTVTIPTGADTLVARTSTDTLTNKTLTAPVIATMVSGGQTVTVPAAADTLVGKATTDTLTNKSINLTNNTLAGTLAQFNTAMSDGSFAQIAGPTFTGTVLGDILDFSGVGSFAGTLTAEGELQADGVVQTPSAALTSSATITLSMTGSSKKTLTTTINTTITVSGEVADQAVEVWITQSAAGEHTVAWSGVDKWDGGTAPTMPIGNGDIMLVILSAAPDGTSVYGQHAGTFA